MALAGSAHGGLAAVTAALDTYAPIQPVEDVRAYLKDRKPVADCADELALLITLPAKDPKTGFNLQDETAALVRACKYVADLVRDKVSVQAACKEALKGPYKKRGWNLNTFRPKFDAWAAKRDWIVLVNRAKAPAAWKDGNVGLPEAFLKHCETKLGKFSRRDAKRQALISIQRNWRTGRNEHGAEFVIPGYEADWKKRNCEIIPDGWSYDNIMDQIKRRSRFTPATRAMLHEGESAARAFLPGVLGTKENLRFLEIVTFDDVRLDWLVFDEKRGEAVELWLLVARDRATGLILGYVKHPATIRDDGTASHLGAQQMKELAAQVLERFPLPPYLVNWVIERGTATLQAAVEAALSELLNNRIKVHFTSMIGDSMKGDFRNAKRPRGYKEKAKGNSGAKGDHEAGNRLLHTQGSFMPGQIGASYGIRPADLNSRIKECKEIWNLRQMLPESKRGDVRYPLTVLQTEADKYIREFCSQQNYRDEHDIEGFGKVLEWLDAAGQRQPSHAAPHPLPPGAQWLKPRMQMPVERAAELIQAVVGKWDRVSPAILRTFLEHTQRLETVTAKGQIKIDIAGDEKIFVAPDQSGLPVGTKVLCYFHHNDPQFLHLTSGDGRILGTWYQRNRTPYLDQKALAEALRYNHAAREAAMDIARDLAAPEVAELEAMRAHNATLAPFVVTADVPDALGYERGSAAGRTLQTFKAVARENQTNPPTVEPEPDCTADILSEE
jgi:hypothetical protein